MAERPTITSASNPRIKAALRLRDRAEREATGLTLIDGAREIRRAAEAGVAIETAFVASASVRTDDALAALVAVRRSGAELVEVTEAVLARLGFGDRSDGLVVVARRPATGLADLPSLPAAPLVVVVDEVEKPGNLGAILRTADGAGADALIVADPRTDPFNPNAIRASLGTVFTVPLAVAPADEVRAWLREHGIRVVATVVGAERSYAAADLRGPVAIVLGSEAEGLGKGWTEAGVEPVSLPMHGVADSLNVAATAAVLLYEAVRQRSVLGDRAD